MSISPSPELAVRNRYASAAHAPEAALCCPIEYDPRWLKAIPAEVIERDYGCGDPSRWLQPGDTVLDLGSGTGKICFIAAQVVGASGRVIGIDMTDDMLGVARRAAPQVAEAIGYANVEFRKGRIQDLALDLERLDRALAETPLAGAEGYLAAERMVERLRAEHPLVVDDSVDAVVSNCVLNLVAAAEKPRLFREIFRVLRDGGRAVISDIVSDEPVPAHLQADPQLWSGCISGALTEEEFVRAFEQAGFHGIELAKRDAQPWRVVEGIEFRSVTVRAWKAAPGPCFERNQAVIYKGPFKTVLDDDGHALARGVRTAVCDKTFRRYGGAAYAAHFERLEPAVPVPLAEAAPFDCERIDPRDPREMKAAGAGPTTSRAQPDACRAPHGACC
jgi:SAM-dependent methyltransferase